MGLSSHFDDWKLNCFIVCCLKIISILIHMIIDFYLFVQLNIKGTKRPNKMIKLSFSWLEEGLRYFLWWAIRVHRGKKVTINNPTLISLIKWIYELESIRTNNFIITVHYHHHFIPLTEVISRILDVVCCIVSLLIFVKLYPDSFRFIFIKCRGIEFGLSECFISRCIVDEHNMKITILLIKYRLEDLLVTIMVNVVVTWHNYTKLL